MAEPQVRYVRSADGTKIAYSSLGRGRPLVWIISPLSMTTIGVDPYIARVRQSLNRLAERRMVVRVDPRGLGLSDHDVTDRSLDAYVADVSAVIALLQNPVDLVTEANPAIGVACAARQPGRVRRLVLVSPARPARPAAPATGVLPRIRILRDLADVDFDFFKQVMALMSYGWDEGKAMAQLLTDLTHDEWAAAVGSLGGLDASPETSGVRCPTLVLHLRGGIVPLDVSRDLAASIADAEMRVVDTESNTPWDVNGLVAEAIIEFLDRDDMPAADSSLPSGMAVILFTDIVDSTALTERLGDTVFRTAARALDESMRAAMREVDGAPVDGKVLGDGVMGVFASASQAIAAARRCVELSAESELRLHVGLHAGDVIREAGNVYGGAVNIASRICALSAPGEILVSATVRDLARTSAGVTFADRGDHALKGIDDTVRLYEVRWRE